MFSEGRGVARDYTEAAVWYRAEAEHGGPVAQFYIGVSYRDGRGGLARDAAEAQEWFNIAAALASLC
jgi:TPR repeat protein